MKLDEKKVIEISSIKNEPKWMLERLAHLLTARILQGHGILRPDCAVEISAQAAV